MDTHLEGVVGVDAVLLDELDDLFRSHPLECLGFIIRPMLPGQQYADGHEPFLVELLFALFCGLIHIHIHALLTQTHG